MRAAGQQRVDLGGDGAAAPCRARGRRVPRGLRPAAAERGARMDPMRRLGARVAPLGVLARHGRLPVRHGALGRPRRGARGRRRQLIVIGLFHY